MKNVESNSSCSGFAPSTVYTMHTNVLVETMHWHTIPQNMTSSALSDFDSLIAHQNGPIFSHVPILPFNLDAKSTRITRMV